MQRQLTAGRCPSLPLLEPAVPDLHVAAPVAARLGDHVSHVSRASRLTPGALGSSRFGSTPSRPNLTSTSRGPALQSVPTRKEPLRIEPTLSRPSPLGAFARVRVEDCLPQTD